MITVRIAMAQLILKVRSWRFGRRLARAEKRPQSIAIIVEHAETSAKLGMTALLGHLNNSKPMHKDWTK